MRMPKFPPTLTSSFAMAGGENLVTPAIMLKPGELLFSQNYEATLQGYRRMGGYERFDGRPKPSAAVYHLLNFDAGSAEISVGDAVTGATTGASGEALYVYVDSGTWGGSDAVGRLILFNVTGTFQDNENLQVSAATKAVANGANLARGADNDTDDATFQIATIEATRDDIGQVPGSGAILGVATYKGTKYAFRNNAGGTAAVMHKSTTAGWVECDLGYSLNFDAGAAEFAENETLTGATSGATATIKRVILDDGDWVNNDLVTNGGFDTDTAWTKGANWAISGGVATHTAGATEDIEESIVINQGDICLVTFTVSGRSAGSITPKVGTTAGTARSTNATFEEQIVAGAGSLLEFTPTTDFDGSIDNVTVRVLDASGRLVLYSVSGGPFQDNETITSASGSATANGASAANTLTAGGRFEFEIYNFKGSASTIRLHGCDGVSKGFEWDGSVFVPITTGMTVDAPTHVKAYKKHLFYMFAGGSVQHSPIGDPTGKWTPVTGAAEIGVGDEGMGFAGLPGDTLGIFTRNTTQILYGTSSADWNLVSHSRESGAIEWTIQELGYPRYLDDRGMMSFQAVQEYGDFKASTFSQKIQPLLDTLKTLAIASMRVKAKDQYRLFFSDGTFVVVTFNGNKVVGCTRGNYGKTVYCCCSGEDANGFEELFFGSDDGYVYQADKGTSWDGEAVEGFLRVPFNHLKSPRYKKRYRKAVLEVDAPAGIEKVALEFTPEFEYGNPDLPVSATENFTVASGGGFWDLVNWGQFYWDSQVIGEAAAYIDGSGTNMGMLIRSYNTYAEPHTIQAATLHYTVRGLKR